MTADWDPRRDGEITNKQRGAGRHMRRDLYIDGALWARAE
jgi:hypothetical protein